ncbi:hypothetical protein [Dyadobacter diqingensis]|uniref:hypothetical protein n=1 Tax=Dyadobacter diqingensis TaxID=2938121 RepID=UPI0020C56B18|nr:hypothetical protein [Dyadobacter diqingensis]
MSEPLNWNDDIDYDTIWFVVGQITNQISGQGLKALQEKLEDEGLELTGKLKSSLFREVRQNNNAWMTEVAMQFEMYGRFNDLKTMTYTKRASVWAMKDFADNILNGTGTNRAKHTPFTDLQLKGRRGPVEKEQVAWRIAWAIAKSRINQPIVMRKGKGWYIKNYMREFYGEIEMNIQAAAAKAVLNTVAKALKDR